MPIIQKKISGLNDGVEIQTNDLMEVSRYNTGLSKYESFKVNLNNIIPQIIYFTATDNQTTFDIGINMQYNGATEMFINGIKQRYGADFYIDALPNLIKYYAINYSIKENDLIEIRYFIA